MVIIRARGTCVHNYDFEFEIEDQDLDDDEASMLVNEYFYEHNPSEIDTDGFVTESITVTYPDEEEGSE